MAKITKSQDELIEDLLLQLQFLSDSSKNFDEGKNYEAIRMATTLRVLLRDTPKQHSLFEQLDIRKKIYYLNTSTGYSPNNLLTQQCLLMMRMSAQESGSKGEYLPFFGEVAQKRWSTVGSWWNEIVIADGKQNTFTRQEIILYLSDQDGGAHVDPSLDEKYFNLKNRNSMKWVYSDRQGREKQLDNSPVYMTVRQICYELMYSIRASENTILKMYDHDNLYLCP